MKTFDSDKKPEPQREADLFEAAAPLAGAERAAFLNGACHGDPALRERLEALLAANDDKDSFLEPAAPMPESTPVQTIKVSVMDNPADDTVGTTIGRYKILENVGEGGCGVVYVAEQIEPVRRRVALKVIKLGMDTKQVVARFEAERQALAMMDHPNIAKVLDAGTTEAGRPYFVMELVRGIRITEYCDQNQLSTRNRLELFIKVCQAVQHAHQKGIIHRDIKPSNILVTLHDGVPVPKVIDFGIAKATEGRLTDATVYTQLHQFIGTPAYMSPEQAEMSGLDIDTRSDIYSLGVLLYELLAGSTPFDAKELMASGLDVMRKTIREKEPVRPSTRFATLKAEELTTAAKRRSTDTSKLLHELRGDLDWIVMKCLEKDRTRRYDTANGLAMDLKRHLVHEPVVARPPSAAYRFEKAVRRNKTVFAAATAIVAALILGVIGTTLGLLRAEKQHQVAEAARKEQSRLREIAVKSLDGEKTQRTRAEAERHRAETQEMAARRTAYNSDMNLVQQAMSVNNLGRAQTLLNRQRPQAGQPDLRGWEWRYLWSQTRPDEHEIFLAGTNRIFFPLSFSGDGRLLAWSERQGETKVADLISRRTILQRTKAGRPVFAHHGARLAFVGQINTTNDTIVLLDMATQKENRIDTSWRNTEWFGFTSDDRQLLTLSLRPGARASDRFPCHLTAWESDTGRQLWQRQISFIDPFEDYHLAGRLCAISPDDTAFALALPGGRVQVLEIKDGSERFTINTTKDRLLVVAFSPDGSTLLTGGGYVEPAIRCWDARNGEAQGSLEGHRSGVTDLLFTPDGTRLISSSGDQTIRLWDWPTRTPSSVLRGHLTEVDGLALAPDGQTLASRDKDGSIYLWDLTRPSRHLGYQTLPGLLTDWSPVFTPDSQTILGVERNGGVALWDAHTLNETRRLWGASSNADSMETSPDARWVIRREAAHRLRVWDVRSGLESTNFIAAPKNFDSLFTENGRFLVTSYGSATNLVLETWDTATWQRRDSRIFHFSRIAAVFTPSLPNSYVVRADGAFHFFDVSKLDEAPKRIGGVGDFHGAGEFLDLDGAGDDRMPGAVFTFNMNQNALTASSNSQMVALENRENIFLWDMATFQPLDAFRGFALSAHSVAFSPDGQRLAAGGDGQEAVKLWDTGTRQEVLTLSGEGSAFRGLKFSVDGRYLLAINRAGLAHLWSAPSLAEIEAAEATDKGDRPR